MIKTKTDPFPYQRDGADRIDHFLGRALLADEPGLGKTLQFLIWLAENRSARPAIVVCPATARWHWQREAEQHIGMRSVVLEGKKPFADGLVRPNVPLWIINYDILGPWVPFLKSLRPKAICADEMHYVKDQSSKRWKNLDRLSEGVPYFIGLTGTPVMNRPIELWPILKLINPKVFPSRWSFGQEFCAPELTPWGWKFNGAANLDRLHEILVREVMIRRRKADVLRDLPPHMSAVVPLPMVRRHEYDKAEKDFLGWLADKGKATLGGARAQAVVKLGYLIRLAGELKVPAVKEWVRDVLDSGQDKLILFGRHRNVLEPIHDHFRREAVLVHGGVTGRHRETALEEFKRSVACHLLVGNIDAAGVAWNGVVADSVAFCEMDWVTTKHTQARDRVSRIGQVRATMDYWLVARGTVEEKLASTLLRKRDVVSDTVDGGHGDKVTVLDELVDLLSEEAKR